MTKDLQTISLYKQVKKPSDYIGTVNALEKVGDFKGIPRPVTDSIRVQAYGERAEGMITVTVLSDVPVKIRDVIELTNGDMYRVLSISRFTTHNSLTAEKDDKARSEICR